MSNQKHLLLRLLRLKNTRQCQGRAKGVVSYPASSGKTFRWQEEKMKWKRKRE